MGATFNFDLFEVDGVDFRVDGVHATGDTKVMKDEGAEANTTNGFVDEGQGYSITLTATEMQVARGKIYIVDSATKAWLDTSITFETYGHASAQHAMDFDDAVRGGMTALPNAAADAAGGLATSLGGATGIDDLALEATIGTPVEADLVTDVAAVQTTVDAIETDTQNIQTRIPAVLIAGRIDADATAISGDSVAADNLEAGYDETGLTGDNFPAKQSQVENISTVGAAIHVSAIPSPNGFTLTTGSEVGDEDRTLALDGVKHELSDAAGTLDAIYKFDIGGSAAPVSVTLTGNFNSNNDTFSIFGNTGTDGTPVWVQIGVITGVNSGANTVHTFNMFNNMIVTDVAGEVQVRVQATGLSSSSFDVDQVFVSKSDTSRSVGYANGAIWLNTLASNTSTESFVDGVADNPVSTIAAAKTLSTNLGLGDFHILNGSSVALSETSDNESYFGDNYDLDLGGQSCDGIHVVGASVTGTGTAATGEMHFDGSSFLTTTSVQGFHADFCRFAGTVTFSLAGNQQIHNSYSGVAGSGAPTFAFAAAALSAEFRNWAGSISFTGLTSDDTLTVGGTLGTVDLGSPASAVSVEIRGTYKAIINVGSAVVNTDGAIKGVDVASTLANTVAIEVDTNELQADWANGGRLDLIQDAIKAVTDLHPNSGAFSDLAAILAAQGTFVVDNATDLAALQIDVDQAIADIAALNDVSVTDLLAKASEALDTVTYSEPSGPPTWPMTITQAQFWGAVLGIQKLTQTSTTLLARNSADSASLGTATVSDDGTTAIRGKFV